jgi:phosphoribosylanthranilate isomerase
VSIAVKICGITDDAALRATIEKGALYAGFVFCKNSPRTLTIEAAQKLVNAALSHITAVGLFVDPTDDELRRVLRAVPLGMIQLHGKETPERVKAIRALAERPVMKAIGVASAMDLDQAKFYEAADRLLFDTKSVGGKLPGGTGTSFDWSLLQGRKFKKPWFLAGGLTAQNLMQAILKSGAEAVDVSSGVEDRPGHKDPAKIRAFMDIAKKI